ncbi:MAG: MFS transporter [Gracilibacteraceae bacterium]|jgi:MFS family permease|nr:MFS transporter [Gracilibacteraceae bacterium]
MKNFILIYLTNFFIATNFYLLMVTISSFAMDYFAASPSQGGLACSLFVIGALFARLFSGQLVERVGNKHTLVFGLGLNLVMSTLYFAVGGLGSLYAVRFLHGVGFGFSSTVAGAIVANYLPQERFGEGIAVFMLSITLATALGPFLGMLLLNTGDHTLLFFCNVAFISLGFAMSFLLTQTESPPPENPPPAPAGPMWIEAFIATGAVPISLFCGLAYMCYSSLMSFLLSYARDIGLVRAAGFFFLLYSAAILLSRPFAGRIMDKKGDNFVIYPGIAIYAVGMFILSGARHGAAILLAGALIGLGYGALQSSGQTIALKSVPPHRRALGAGTCLMFCDLGTGIGPYIFGLFISLAGYRPMYFGVACFILVTALLYHGLHGRKHRRPGG